MKRVGLSKALEVHVGESFLVEAEGMPAAGYLWKVKSCPPHLMAEGEENGEWERPDAVGGATKQLFKFRGLTAGEGVIILEYARPWENNGTRSGGAVLVVVS